MKDMVTTRHSFLARIIQLQWIQRQILLDTWDDPVGHHLSICSLDLLGLIDGIFMQRWYRRQNVVVRIMELWRPGRFTLVYAVYQWRRQRLCRLSETNIRSYFMELDATVWRGLLPPCLFRIMIYATFRTKVDVSISWWMVFFVCDPCTNFVMIFSGSLLSCFHCRCDILALPLR